VKRGYGAALLLLVLTLPLPAETFRTIVAGLVDLSVDDIDGRTLELSYVDSVVVRFKQGTRFMRGVELELKVPPAYLKYRGSLSLAFYSDLKATPEPGVADISALRAGFSLLPNKLQAIYQIPIRTDAALKSSPYVTIPTDVVLPDSFPLLVRLMPVIKGLSEEIEQMRFYLNVKPILSDEGAVRVQIRYPEQLKGRPFTMLIDDAVVADPAEERLLKEGEHHLAIVSDDYRNESRRFNVQRGKVLELLLELQDPTPLLIFEGPENSTVYFDDRKIVDYSAAIPTEPGEHQVRFQVGDYSIVRPLVIRKGRTYRIALTIDVTVTEKE